MMWDDRGLHLKIMISHVAWPWHMYFFSNSTRKSRGFNIASNHQVQGDSLHGNWFETISLVGGDWNMTFIFPYILDYIGNNHPNWLILTHIFRRGWNHQPVLFLRGPAVSDKPINSQVDHKWDSASSTCYSVPLFLGNPCRSSRFVQRLLELRWKSGSRESEVW